MRRVPQANGGLGFSPVTGRTGSQLVQEDLKP
jgi:hypothetical protein